MNERTKFLREQTLLSKNKVNRKPMPSTFTVKDEPFSLPERKALGLKMIFDNMPLYIGEKELIVGTRTFLSPHEGNEDGHDICAYYLSCGVPYVNAEDIEKFGCDQSYHNKTHYTPDYSILLKKGIGGILNEVEEKQKESGLTEFNRNFLSSVHIAYSGLKNLISRYANYAYEKSNSAKDETEKKELFDIYEVCRNISTNKPASFREAVQLLWFGHLGTIIESFEFINYGRLDVVLNDFLGDTPRDEALQLIECLLLKMYDQVDVVQSYLNKYAAQLVVTLGGVLPNGENAASETTMLFLDAIDSTRLPEPEFNLRIHSKNPAEFLEKATKLTVSGCNFISYYNDDLFIDSMIKAGVNEEDANNYAFDLCQDITVPGKADYYVTGHIMLADALMHILRHKNDFSSFEELAEKLKSDISVYVKERMTDFNTQLSGLVDYKSGRENVYFERLGKGEIRVDCHGRSPMAPLPFLSGVFHGSIENATDMVFESYPVKHKGMIFGTATECINSLAAIKKLVFDEKKYSLSEVFEVCENNFEGKDGEIMRALLWNAPKWGNDDDYVDGIAKDILEFGLKECMKYKTFTGGLNLAGIHQPHPVATGNYLMATPEGRKSGTPVAVTLTPESGTMRKGPTAALKSAAKLNHELIQWNNCVMVNYFASVFKGNEGNKIFKDLLTSYFKDGGMQHQPNILDVEELRKAQASPEQYKDLIVRLWGVSAHFVDLTKELQDEIIARFE